MAEKGTLGLENCPQMESAGTLERTTARKDEKPTVPAARLRPNKASNPVWNC